MCSVQFSRSVVSDSLQPHGLQHARLPCSSLTPRAWSDSCPSSWWCHPTILSSVISFSSCFQSSQYQDLFQWVFTSGGQNIGTAASALVLPMNIQDWFPLGLTVWSPCCPRDFQESSPAPQFERINSSALNLLYGPALTSICDYWKDHRFSYVDLCWQSDVSAF